MNMFCEFQDTNLTYNNKKIYQCKYCNIKLTLDNIDTRVLCFKKQEALSDFVNPHLSKPIDNIDSIESVLEIAKQQAYDKANIDNSIFANSGQPQQDNLCSKEQIEYRMSICKNCEYFKENSCLLCGCTVVRERNYNNKLAQKNQHCPIMKWKEIK